MTMHEECIKCNFVAPLNESKQEVPTKYLTVSSIQYAGTSKRKLIPAIFKNIFVVLPNNISKSLRLL